MPMTKSLHPRNIHNKAYDYKSLAESHPPIGKFLRENQYGELGIDFSNNHAVVALNQALLIHHYQVLDWTLPKNNLCPPIPGRVDYIHYIADLITEEEEITPPVGKKIKGLDIGTGASCIYPILGNSVYGWKFVGTDINSQSINHCKTILKSNPTLKKNIKLRYQDSVEDIFNHVIKPGEYFDFTICNPPFFESADEANKASKRKVKNLNLNKEKKGHGDTKIKASDSRNFGGKEHELWCPGGESTFISNMITQSQAFANQCGWFTTLVSSEKNISEFEKQLKDYDCEEVRVIKMKQGQKSVHILAWRFKFNPDY